MLYTILGKFCWRYLPLSLFLSFALLNFSLENDSYTGVLGEVAYNRADVSFNSRFLDDPMIGKPYRYSKTNHLDSICFVVPQAKSLTKMQIVWKTFTFEVWLCVAVAYVLMSNSFQFFNKCNMLSERKISDPCMTSLQVNRTRNN